MVQDEMQRQLLRPPQLPLQSLELVSVCNASHTMDESGVAKAIGMQHSQVLCLCVSYKEKNSVSLMKKETLCLS